MTTNNSINLSQSGMVSYDGAGVFSGRTLQSLTPNLTITNGSGIGGDPSFAITGLTSWVEVTGTSQAMSVNTGYIANNAGLITFTLPSTAAIGDSLRILGKGVGGWKIAQNATQQIIFGKLSTTSGIGGSLASTHLNDCIELRCITSGTATIWEVASSVGNITVV